MRWFFNYLCYFFSSFLENSLQIINLKMDLTGLKVWNPLASPAVTDNLTASIVLDQGNYGRILNLSYAWPGPCPLGEWQQHCFHLHLIFSVWKQPILRALCRISASEAPFKILTLWIEVGKGSEREHRLGINMLDLKSFLKIPSWYGASHLTFLDLCFPNYYLKGFG